MSLAHSNCDTFNEFRFNAANMGGSMVFGEEIALGGGN